MVKLNKVGAIRARELIKAGQINKASDWEAPDLTGLEDHHYLGLDKAADDGAVLPFGQMVSGRFMVFRAALVVAAETAAGDEERYDERIADEALDLIELVDKAEGVSASPPAVSAPAEDGDDKPTEPPPDPGKSVQKTMKLGKMVRVAKFDRSTINEADRTVELSISSEEPYLRWFGYEILGHQAGEIRSDYLDNNMALCWMHNWDQHLGSIKKWWVSDGQLRVLAKFKHGVQAEEKFQDVINGDLTQASIGYEVHRMQLIEDGMGEGPDTYRAVDWTPLEGSLVTVAADITVGVGKDYGGGEYEAVVETRKADWSPPTYVAPAQPAVQTRSAGGGESMPPELKAAADSAVSPEVIASERQAEREAMGKNIGEIFNIAEQLVEQYPQAMKMAKEAARNGQSPRDFKTDLYEAWAKSSGTITDESDGFIGLSEKEKSKFSWIRFLNAMDPQASLADREAARFEIEVGEEGKKQLKHRTATGPVIPMDMLRHKAPAPARAARAMQSGDLSLGGSLVGTEMMSFVDLFTEKLVLADKVQVFTGLTGNIAFPKATGGITSAFVKELAGQDPGNISTGAITMRPRTGQMQPLIISKKLLAQVGNMDIEFWAKNMMAGRLARGFEYAGFNGAGVGEDPEGVLNADGVNLVALGTNGAAPTWDMLVDMEGKVADYDADVGSAFYVVNSKTRAVLKKTKMDGTNLPFIWMPGQDDLNGYPALVSNLLPKTLTKGTGENLSAAVFGFGDQMVMGFWGGVEFTVDPYTLANERALKIYAHQDGDIAFLHPESFSVCKDIVTG